MADQKPDLKSAVARAFEHLDNEDLTWAERIERAKLVLSLAYHQPEAYTGAEATVAVAPNAPDSPSAPDRPGVSVQLSELVAHEALALVADVVKHKLTRFERLFEKLQEPILEIVKVAREFVVADAAADARSGREGTH